ncbi:uncharacterized protein [Choristoneura fumiferana]|uniref:uncharacterized protein n=1 Tax=Choristoneura fumiferana TaxID=7141 RepID=UPI003D1570B2
MTKETKEKENTKPKQNKRNESKAKIELEPAASTVSVKRTTRQSNVKEIGFYKFKSMLDRNVTAQPTTPDSRQVASRNKKRVKTKRPQK